MIYRVNNVEIDTSNFQLTENGAPISVEPKVFDLIVYMVTNRNRLITRQELFDNIWRGRIVSDTSLSNHIKSARKALGDDGQKQRVIKTVHGRGYQFVAETESLTEPVDTPDVSQTPTAPGDRKSIAVLAFSDLSPERDQEYFSDGLSEELINLLAKVPELRVISRTSAFSFKGKDTTAEEIGRLLNVTHLLEGSVRKAGNQLRITAQLVQVSDESHLWSETFDRQMKNVFEIQDDIAHAVLDQLKLNLFNESVKSTPVNPDAYTLFLEARFLSEQHTADSNAKAEKVIRDSISLDPDYAPAWDLLGHVIYAATTNYLLVAAEEGLEEAAAAIQRSIDIDPEYAPAYASRAILNVSNWEFEEARKNIEKAMLLDRNNSRVFRQICGLPGSLREGGCWLPGLNRAPRPISEKMELRDNHPTETRGRDAAQDYPQSGSEVQIFCVRGRPLGRDGARTRDRGRASPAQRQPADLLRLWPQAAGLRYFGREAV